jgi:hypothetical protein
MASAMPHMLADLVGWTSPAPRLAGRDGLRFQVGQQRAELSLRVFMMLLGRQPKSDFQHRAGFVAPTGGEQRFAEADVRHHPIRLFPRTKTEVRHGFVKPLLGRQRLREAESKQLIFRLLLD